MKSMLFILLVLCYSLPASANDGAYYGSGNQLIPIAETNISVTKEVLRLKKMGDFVEVSVYYEFENPSEAKTLLVGFEAMRPSGDLKTVGDNASEHPYMRNFSVKMNGKPLSYQVAHVADTLYEQQGSIRQMDLATYERALNEEYADFFYVYHFNAPFKKGKNVIEHCYKFDLSSGVVDRYFFEYVLTAAKRWANKQIDDFTLEVDMGDFEEFYIIKSFFDKATDWQLDGKGVIKNVPASGDFIINKAALKFYIQNGKLVFKKRNFKPRGELYLESINYFMEELARGESQVY